MTDTAARTRRPTGSFFVQLITLTGVALVASNLISLAILVNLPPPTPDFYRLSEIEQTLRGTPPNFGDRKPLITRIDREPPRDPYDGRPGKLTRKLAYDLSLHPSHVVVAGKAGLLQDRRVARNVREKIIRYGGRDEHFMVAPFEIGVMRDDGRWMVVRPQPAFGLDPWQQRLLLTLALTLLVMAPVAWVLARRMAAPIALFATAAERLGRDPRAEPLPATGPAELRTAVTAFNQMQERLSRYVEDRTAMVAAIAHDLRTPLTRLRFRLEGLPDDQRAKIAADLDQMEEMVSAALTFVRDTGRSAERTRLELSSLLESLCDEMAETGADAQAVPGEKLVIEGDPMALRRLFTNLLENAVKFGERARARTFAENGFAVVEIEDDGPGVEGQDQDRLFEPFYRGEPSRSRQTGGIGLGLAIVRSIARAHGGEVTLNDRPGGGATARVVLPL